MSVPALPEPPYPKEIRARGWRFELDMERVRASDTWTLADPELRPWLLMLWATAWGNHPIGLPGDERLIAAQIGMPYRTFQAHREILLRGWTMHADGRLYHATITERVLEMAKNRRHEADRKALQRADKKQRLAENVPTMSRGTPPGVRDQPPTTNHQPLEKTKSKPFAADRISFDPAAEGNAFGGWHGIQAKDIAEWERAYPAVAIRVELARMAEWVKANPANRKSQWRRFVVNWLNRAQDRAPRVPTHSAASTASKKVAL